MLVPGLTASTPGSWLVLQEPCSPVGKEDHIYNTVIINTVGNITITQQELIPSIVLQHTEVKLTRL